MKTPFLRKEDRPDWPTPIIIFLVLEGLNISQAIFSHLATIPSFLTPDLHAPGIPIFLPLIGIAFRIILGVLVAIGKGWVRDIDLVVVAFITMSYFLLEGEHTLTFLFNLISFLIYPISIILLLFLPTSNRWFNQMREARLLKKDDTESKAPQVA